MRRAQRPLLLATLLAAACSGGGQQAGPVAPPAAGAAEETGGARGGASDEDRRAVEERHAAEVAELRGRVAALEQQVAARAAAPEATREPRPARPRPDPAAIYSVPIDGAPSRGSDGAKVVIVKAYEYACPFCAKSRATDDQLLEAYRGDVRIVYKHLVIHPQTATEPALLACAAHLQGKFAEVDALLWAAHDGGTADGGYAAAFDEKALTKIARKARLNRKRLAADREACREIIRRDQAQVGAVGGRGTPTFYVNGRVITGAQPLQAFTAVVDEELARAEQRLAAEPSLDVREHYRRFVVEQGKTTFP